MAVAPSQRQINVCVETSPYRALEAIARQERRLGQQAARPLMEEGLLDRSGGDDTPGSEIAALAVAGGAFDWLRDEPDLYNDDCGEPV